MIWYIVTLCNIIPLYRSSTFIEFGWIAPNLGCKGRDENREGKRPDQVNPAPVLVKACQGQKYPGFQDLLDGSLEQGRDCQFFSPGLGPSQRTKRAGSIWPRSRSRVLSLSSPRCARIHGGRKAETKGFSLEKISPGGRSGFSEGADSSLSSHQGQQVLGPPVQKGIELIMHACNSFWLTYYFCSNFWAPMKEH